ncbi:MAG: PilZ domain-containing protein [candidate division Zixibacteria bacterium]|nr:PilZ domain-containing protein [candidate division Zixibacteria bacterium]
MSAARNSGPEINSPITLELDYSVLVGRSIRIYSRQFAGQALESKVLSVTDGRLLVESGVRHQQIGCLVNNQTTVLRFEYKGQEIAVRAQLQRTAGGRCYFRLSQDVAPLAQRRFQRRDLPFAVRLATFPRAGYRHRNLANLRWLQTELVNFSSGGVLVDVPAVLSVDVMLLMNIEAPMLDLPQLLLGQVRHCHPTEDLHFRAGVEFVVRETCRKIFSVDQMRAFPSSLFAYTSRDREVLNKKLILRKSDDVGSNPTDRR